MLAWFRALRWWQMTLLVAGALLAAAGLLFVAAVGYFIFAFDRALGSDEFGPRSIDESTAAAALDRRDIRIPDGFTFASMTQYRVFVGFDSYTGHYNVPGDLAAAQRAIATANPTRPAFTPVDCGHEIVIHDFKEMDDFTCDGTDLRLSTRTDPQTDNYAGTPPDTESLLLANRGGKVTLFVVARGH